MLKLIKGGVYYTGGRLIKENVAFMREEQKKAAIKGTLAYRILKAHNVGDDEHLKAWLIRVAINKSINAAKRGARRRTVGIDNLPLSRRGEETQLDEELARLSADDRQVIYLHYYEGYSAKEIGKFLKKSKNAVYILLSRGRAKLKELLKEDEDE